ncbi:MAG: hypothetical protein LUQ50_11230 [Methanospirillum sp.]|uniref:tetratricopeptide repeat protein n=1 Tax=Methanospirillum sp. TaxID=45200 RepID=UPI00236BE5FF|nr:hypothetical protein [Methanospirillum sp.]MDD1729627.1 hypothetical protein [Methanospirillum sp.]
MTSEEESWFREGKKAFLAGDLQRAVERFQAVVETDEEHHLAWNAMGVVYSKAGQVETADICFRNALILSPDNPVYLQNLGRNNRRIKLQWEKTQALRKPERFTRLQVIMIGLVLIVAGIIFMVLYLLFR